MVVFTQYDVLVFSVFRRLPPSEDREQLSKDRATELFKESCLKLLDPFYDKYPKLFYVRTSGAPFLLCLFENLHFQALADHRLQSWIPLRWTSLFEKRGALSRKISAGMRGLCPQWHSVQALKSRLKVQSRELQCRVSPLQPALTYRPLSELA